MVLQTSSRPVGDIVILDCKGRIVFGEETSFLRSQVKDLLTEYRHIVLNLTEVSYIDSGGLGTLVAMYTSAQNSGAKIALTGLAGKLKDVLQITKLVTVFEIFATTDEAVAHFSDNAKHVATVISSD
jgi:anti-sigma B factor antagonist